MTISDNRTIKQAHRSRNSRIVYFLLPLLLSLWFVLEYAPNFLAYSTKPKKTDVIILLVGPNDRARQKEVDTLVKEGFSEFIMVPAYGKLFYKSGKNVLHSIGEMRLGPYIQQDQIYNLKEKPRFKFYENTHLEILQAKLLMERFGFASAIVVSSPYHMRRVKMIADQIFDQGKYKLYFIPTRYEKTCNFSWIVSEYAKIAWFLLYDPLTGND